MNKIELLIITEIYKNKIVDSDLKISKNKIEMILQPNLFSLTRFIRFIFRHLTMLN